MDGFVQNDLLLIVVVSLSNIITRYAPTTCLPGADSGLSQMPTLHSSPVTNVWRQALVSDYRKYTVNITSLLCGFRHEPRMAVGTACSRPIVRAVIGDVGNPTIGLDNGLRSDPDFKEVEVPASLD